MRSVAALIGLGTIGWVIFTPDDVNAALVVAWSIISAHGLFNAMVTLRRVRSERIAAKLKTDPRLALIADNNVRRQVMLGTQLAAFLIIGLGVLTGLNNVTVSRALIVLVLLLMSGGAWLDADEIDQFDNMTEDMREDEPGGSA